MADVVITNVSLTPNPVNTNAEYMIAVEVVDRVYGIMDSDSDLILSSDEYAIEYTE